VKSMLSFPVTKDWGKVIRLSPYLVSYRLCCSSSWRWEFYMVVTLGLPGWPLMLEWFSSPLHLTDLQMNMASDDHTWVPRGYGVLTWIGISFQSIVYYAIRSNVYGSKLNQEVNATTAFKIDRDTAAKSHTLIWQQ
jgi:hypothetical protein